MVLKLWKSNGNDQMKMMKHCKTQLINVSDVDHYSIGTDT